MATLDELQKGSEECSARMRAVLQDELKRTGFPLRLCTYYVVGMTGAWIFRLLFKFDLFENFKSLALILLCPPLLTATQAFLLSFMLKRAYQRAQDALGIADKAEKALFEATRGLLAQREQLKFLVERLRDRDEGEEWKDA